MAERARTKYWHAQDYKETLTIHYPKHRLTMNTYRKSQKKRLWTGYLFVLEVNAKVYRTSVEKNTTHLIMETEVKGSRTCQCTTKYFMDIAHHCLVLDRAYMDDCLTAGHYLPKFGAILLVCMIGMVRKSFKIDTITPRAFNDDATDNTNTFPLQYEHHANNTWSCNGKLFLVYRCVEHCGGWGDRQKGIVSSFLLALLTNRTFIVDIQGPGDVLNHLEPNIYDWTRCKKYVNELPESDTEFLRLTKNTRRINSLNNTGNDETWSKRAIALKLSSYSKVIRVVRQHPDTVQQLNWIKNFQDYELLGLILRSLFKPKLKLRNHLNNFIKESTQDRQLVCGHLRMGQNPNIPDEIATLKPMNETAMYAFLDQFNDVNKYVIYLASDSDLVREHAAKIFPNYINLGRKIVHIDKFDHLDSSIACDGFYTVLFEQYLFTQCDYLAIGRSNFAVVAAYMRGHSKGLYLYNRKDSFIPASLADIQDLYALQ